MLSDRSPDFINDLITNDLQAVIKPNTSEDIVIVGMGPTGLAIALEAVQQQGLISDKKSKNIYIISDRASFTRGQIFRLDLETFDFLRGIVPNDIYNEYLSLIGPEEKGYDDHQIRTIQIKTLEEMLLKALTRYPIKIIHLPKHDTNYRIAGIDEANHLLQITNPEREKEFDLKFKYLIATDGAHHSIANFIKSYPIDYEATQAEQIHTSYSQMSYTIQDGVDVSFFQHECKEDVPFSQKPKMHELKEFLWDMASIPEIRLFITNRTVYIGAECPATLLSDKQSIDAWSKLLLRYHLDPRLNCYLTVNDGYKFEVTLQEADRILIPLKAKDSKADLDDQTLLTSTAFFAQAGDALRSPHFLTGSGAMTGLQEAQAYGYFFRSDQSVHALKKLQEDISNIRDRNRAHVDEYLQNRKAREERALHTRGIINIINEIEETDKRDNIVKFLEEPYKRFPHLNREASDLENGATPLIAAVKNVQLTVVKWLFSKNHFWNSLNLNLVDHKGFTAMHYAVEFESVTIDPINDRTLAAKTEILDLLISHTPKHKLKDYLDHAELHFNYYFIDRVFRLTPKAISPERNKRLHDIYYNGWTEKEINLSPRGPQGLSFLSGTPNLNNQKDSSISLEPVSPSSPHSTHGLFSPKEKSKDDFNEHSKSSENSDDYYLNFPVGLR